MQFLVGDIPRFAFGFANPNHAAAAVCAVAPFLWGWRRFAWVGWIASAALVVMLAMTFSRTGLVVLVAEMVAWRCLRRKECGSSSASKGLTQTLSTLNSNTLFHAVVGLSIVGLLVWMWPRMTMDGAVMNRPKIWLAGLKLFAANPFGVGFGNSGLVASAFLLPDGVEVRTLVNSHLTQLVEGGAFVGGAWLVFVSAALLSRRMLSRTWIAFAGLALSACSASVFDWHVLFGLEGAPDFGWINLTLSWLLFVAFVSMGVALIVRGFAWKRFGFAAGVVVVVLAGISGLSVLSRGRDAASTMLPVVEDGFARWGEGPVVYHDGEWGLKAVKGYFPDGARVRIESGVEDVENADGEVWLFGEVAESAARFPGRKVTVVCPSDYYEPPANVVEVRR